MHYKGGDGDYVHYLHCGDSFMSVYIGPKHQLYTLNMCSLLNINYISMKLFKKSFVVSRLGKSILLMHSLSHKEVRHISQVYT